MIFIVFFIFGPLVLFGGRTLALAGILGSIFHTPVLSVIELGAMNLTPMRLLILVAMIRVAARGEARDLKRTSIDTWLGVMLAVMLLLSLVTNNVASVLTWRLGFTLNVAGVYFLFRCWIRTPAEFRGACIALGVAVVPWATEMVFEQLANRNFYAILLNLDVTPAVRGDRTRSQGCFSHAILAGTSAASTLYLILIARKQSPKISWLGAAAAFVGMIASASSGPLLTFMTTLGALMLWYVRPYLKIIRWSVVAGLVGLHIVMKAPVWWLLARIDLTGSSTGDHRAALIDAAIAHFGEWWIVGTEFTRHWLPTGVSWSADQIDITNFYLYFGVEAGLPAMIPFIIILTLAFRRLGDLMDEVRGRDEPMEQMFWIMGCVLFGHCTTFVSVSYFDNSFVLVLLLLATISALSSKPLPVAEDALHAPEPDLHLPRHRPIQHPLR